MFQNQSLPNKSLVWQIPRINLFLYIIQTSVIAVGDNRLALRLENIQVIHHLAAEKRTAILQRRLVDYHFRTFGFHPFHYTLDA